MATTRVTPIEDLPTLEEWGEWILRDPKLNLDFYTSVMAQFCTSPTPSAQCNTCPLGTHMICTKILALNEILSDDKPSLWHQLKDIQIKFINEKLIDLL